MLAKTLLWLCALLVILGLAALEGDVEAQGGCYGPHCGGCIGDCGVVPILQPIYNTPPGPIIVTGPNVPVTISAIVNQNSILVSPTTLTLSMIATTNVQTSTVSATLTFIQVSAAGPAQLSWSALYVAGVAALLLASGILLL